MLKGILGDVPAALLPDKLLELLYASLLAFDAGLSLEGNSVVSIELLLQLDDSFIALVQPASQGNHDVTLFQEKLFVAVDLSLSFLNLGPLTLDLRQLCFIFLPDSLLLFFKGCTELRRIFNLLTTRQDL